MRFCTTHRACETEPGACVVMRAVEIYEPERDPIYNCTLVDALIVTKEDGEWPEWFSEIVAHWISHPDMFLEDLEDAYADALERAEP